MATIIKNKSIVIITSGQPSLNPRLVKEADSLAENGYRITVIYQYWNHWGTVLDEDLLHQKKWTAIRVGGSPQEGKTSYWYSRVRHKYGQKMIRTLGIRSPFAEMAIGRCTNLLVAEAAKHKADLYIAHNLAALPAAVKAANTNFSLSAFDAEDFHRNEVSDDAGNEDVRLKSFIEDKYIPQLNLFWASSNLIAKAYHQLFPAKGSAVILNVFPVDATVGPPVMQPASSLKLFWFSQTIGQNRGLDDVIKALILLNNPKIELHLLGYMPPQATAYLTSLGAEAVKIHYHDTMPAEDLNRFASRFDIGLALEPGFCINNNLALSNKIFTYLQAGLAVVASNTAAQEELLQSWSAIGKVYPKGKAAVLAGIINDYYNDRQTLLNAKLAAYKAARTTLNWETESTKLLHLINQALGK